MGEIIYMEKQIFLWLPFVCDVHSVLWKEPNSYSSLSPSLTPSQGHFMAFAFTTPSQGHFMGFASFHLKHPCTR